MRMHILFSYSFILYIFDDYICIDLSYTYIYIYSLRTGTLYAYGDSVIMINEENINYL
jgi:hypothetical protein